MQTAVVDIQLIISMVCTELGIPKRMLLRKGRKRNLVYARAIICWLAYCYSDLPFTRIGAALKRDHCMAIYYTNMVRDWINNPRLNPDAVKVISNVERNIKNIITT